MDQQTHRPELVGQLQRHTGGSSQESIQEENILENYKI